MGANARLEVSGKLLSNHKNASVRTRAGMGTIGRNQRMKGRSAAYPEEITVINAVASDHRVPVQAAQHHDRRSTLAVSSR